MRQHHTKTDSPCPFPVYSATIRAWSDLKGMGLPSARTVLLVAADFTNLKSNLIAETAIELIDRGLVYVLCWGKDCSRAHGAFDLGNVLWEERSGSERHVVSTEHKEESFEDALWFCLYNAMPDDEWWDGCSTVVVSIGNAATDHQLALIDDLPRLDSLVTLMEGLQSPPNGDQIN